MSWKKLCFIIIVAAAVSFIPQVQAAQESILDSGLVSEVSNCGPNGTQCSLNAFLRLGLNVSQYILGIVGALTLLMFIVGGVMMMLSGGSADKVKKGKDILIGSVIGLAIVFSSYLIIKFTTEQLLGGKFNANLPEETIMERTGACSKAGGKCVTGQCSGEQTTLANTECKKDVESCCVPKGKSCLDKGGKCWNSCKGADTPMEGVCPNNQVCCQEGSGACIFNDLICKDVEHCTNDKWHANYTCVEPTPMCCEN